MTEIRNAVTHNGIFHPDDVFAAALLEKIFPDVTITRSRDPDVIAAADLVFDVGRQYDPAAYRFDHHQPGAPVRPNDIAYSAFGLLWLEFGERYCNDADVARAVDKRLVQVIDANDNGTQLRNPIVPGVQPFEVFDILFNYNPQFGAVNEEYDEQYRKAVRLASDILERLTEVERSNKVLTEYFTRQLEATQDSRYVILEKQGNYKDLAAAFPELLYFISPDEENNTWGVTAVSVPDNAFALKAPLPAEWAGLEAVELAKLTGVSDAKFCHLKRFLAVAESKPGALELLAQALASSSNNGGGESG